MFSLVLPSLYFLFETHSHSHWLPWFLFWGLDILVVSSNNLTGSLYPLEALYTFNIVKLDSYPHHYVSHRGSTSESKNKPHRVNKSTDKERVSEKRIISYYKIESHSRQSEHQDTISSSVVIRNSHQLPLSYTLRSRLISIISAFLPVPK